ncbi:MAG: patatin-like phospholipase family protein, partial [Syntrophaceae bacterium]|nr:patatin-like phospholipase family protein [Syntrophaceae bacterium]
MKKPKVRWLLRLGFLLAALFSVGCAHYPPNHLLKEVSPEGGYRLRNSERSDRSDELLLVL